MIKIICPNCKSDNVRTNEKDVNLNMLHFSCNELGCLNNKSFTFTVDRDSIQKIKELKKQKN